MERRRQSHADPITAYKVTNRDWDGLPFVAEMKFVRFDTLGEYWAPGFEIANKESQTLEAKDERLRNHGGRRINLPWPRESRKRLSAVAQVVSRWEHKMGFAETWQPFASQAKWVRITELGLFELGLPWAEIPFPERDRLRHDAEHNSHIHRMNQVRLSLARGDVAVPRHRWISEREFEENLPLREPGMTRPHKPDGYLELEEEGASELKRSDGSIERIPLLRQSRIAVEIELSRKSYERLGSLVLPSLLEHYDFVWYFCLQEAYQAVVAARRDYVRSNVDRKRIRILLLD
jgi:hypothetical protein